MARRSLTRSNSSSSTLSCITVMNDSRPATVDAQSSTPPTSVTDAASITSSNTPMSKTTEDSTGRARRVRSNVTSYNENALAGSARKAPGARRGIVGSRDISGATLVKDSDGGHALQAGVDALHMNWKMDDMPGDHIRRPALAVSPRRERSLRSQIADKASAAISISTSILGKRGHSALEAGRDTLQNLGKRASLRSRNTPNFKDHSSEEPSHKKLKGADTTSSNTTVTTLARPKRKKYLAQGLYVGQESGFDPRLKESKNKPTILTTSNSYAKLFPPLMFAGKSLLEQGRHYRLPFNVFSPLPPGQPKPEEWRKTQKNVFVGDAAEFWKTSKKLEHSTCICEPNSGCDENCFNRFMFYECDENNCNIGPDHCTNRSFEELRKRCKKGGKYNIGVEVIKTTDRGYGVRSNRTFEPNQIIVEYTGEIITQDECDNRMRKMYKDNECFYLMVFDQNMIIDATRGSIARFVNHACEPNCKMVKWTVAGKPRMALFAGDKGIVTGEELTYDYNFDPFSSKNIQECRCGAPSCRGVLGPKPKERDIKDALKPITQVGTKRKIRDAFSGAKDVVQSAVTKKRKVPAPKSIKKAVSATKCQANKGVGKARAKSSVVAHKILPKQARTKKRSAAVVTFVKRREKQAATTSSTKLVHQRAMPKQQQASMRRNVVRTVKGRARPTAAAPGKSIRVIS